MDWILYTLLNVFGNGSATFLYKIAAIKLRKDIFEIIFCSLLFAAIAYSPFFLISYIRDEIIFSNIEGIFYFLLSLAFNVIALYLYMKAIEISDLSLIGPIDNLRPFFVVVFSLFLLQEKLSLTLLVGMTLIVLGGNFLYLQKSVLKTLKGIWRSNEMKLLIPSTAFYALAAIADKKSLSYISTDKYVFFLLIGTSIIYFLLLLSKKQIKNISIFNPYLMIIGILLTVGVIGIMSAIKISNLSQVIPLQMTRTLYLSLLGFIFLNEKGYMRKLLAAVIMIIGVVFLLR